MRVSNFRNINYPNTVCLSFFKAAYTNKTPTFPDGIHSWWMDTWICPHTSKSILRIRGPRLNHIMPQLVADTYI